MPRTTSAKATTRSSAALGFEAKLWLTADKLRNNMDAAEYIYDPACGACGAGGMFVHPEKFVESHA